MLYKSQNFTDYKTTLTAKHLRKMERGITSNNPVPYVGSPSLYLPEALESKTIDDMTSAELYALYDELEESYPLWIKREADLGAEVPLRHYCIRFFDPIVNGELSDTMNVNEWISDYDYEHILITMGVHGNEKSAVYGSYIFIRDLLSSNEGWANFLKSNFIIHFIPLINVWGFDNFSRNNEAGININRDYESCVSEEAKSVVSLAASLGNKLKLIIDTHNTSSNFGWMGGIPDDIMFPIYRETYAKIAGALLPFHKKIYGDLPRYPYLFIKYSPNEGTMNYWGNTRGYICNTIEAPRIVGGGSVNNQNSSPLMAALLGNLLQTYAVMNKPTSNEEYVFAINPTPADAVVTINGLEANSVKASDESIINWSVEADGYGCQSGTYTMEDFDCTLDIVLGALKLNWQIGAISLSTGVLQEKTTRQVTANMFAKNEATTITANGDFEFLMYAYASRNIDASIIGRLDSEGNFTKDDAGTSGQWLTSIALADYPSDYYYRLVCRYASNNTQTFTEEVMDCAIIS